MARYTGPKHKLARREGVNILDKESNSLQRRLNIPPGAHGRKLRRRPSEFGTQLREKQKAKIMYGILERQFKKIVDKASRQHGDTGENLVSLLETRLDNLVYRMGFAKSRNMARQMVSHGHILVNNRKVNIPSFAVRENDVITVNEKFKIAPSEEEEILPSFVEKKGAKVKLLRFPTKEDVNLPFDLQLIIEYYSR